MYTFFLEGSVYAKVEITKDPHREGTSAIHEADTGNVMSPKLRDLRGAIGRQWPRSSRTELREPRLHQLREKFCAGAQEQEKDRAGRGRGSSYKDCAAGELALKHYHAVNTSREDPRDAAW